MILIHNHGHWTHPLTSKEIELRESFLEDDTVTAYLWNFGGGNTDTAANPVTLDFETKTINGSISQVDINLFKNVGTGEDVSI